jgi:peptide/nickel transport system substrate-binding protein
MGPGDQNLDDLVAELSARRLKRREVLRRAAGLGLTAPVIASLLSACGGDDDDGAQDTPTSAPAAPTATESEAEEATPTEGAADVVTPTEGATDAATPTAAGAAPTDTPAEETPRGGSGKLTLILWQAPTILNLHIGQGGKDSAATRVALEPLFEFDANVEPVMFLASEYPTLDNGLLDPNGLWVIWKLREGVKWHDGEDFSAEDVKFTWEWIVNPDATTTTSAVYQNVESVEVVDDYTIRVNFKSPDPAWFDPFRGDNGVILPEHVFRDYTGAEARNAPANLMPVGTGPFKVVDFKPGDVVLYELFEDYWEPGKPHFDSIELKGGGDATSAARAVLQTGEVDYAWNLQVEPEVLNQLEASGLGQVVPVAGPFVEYLYINFADPHTEVDGARAEPSTEHPIFNHIEARQALNLAIQRDVIAEELYGAAGTATAYIINTPEKFKPDGLTWEYDLDAAATLLDAIDFPDAFESVSLLYQTSVNPVRQKNQEIVKADLEQLGFEVELKSVDSAVYFSSDAGNPDTFAHFYTDIQMYTTGPSSPYPIAYATRYRTDEIAQKANDWSGTNITRYFNPEFDVLHDQAQVEIDEETQIELWHAMMQMVHDDVFEIPIVWRGLPAAVSNRLDSSVLQTALIGAWTNWPFNDFKNWKPA